MFQMENRLSFSGNVADERRYRGHGAVTVRQNFLPHNGIDGG